MNNNVIINVYKPQGITSQGVVTAVKKALNVKTAGHCGTLDPLAEGVLPVMVGRAVKASEYLTDHDKKYVARMRLGTVTDTGDITGNVLKIHEGDLPSFTDVLGVLPDFVGEIVQVPPMYSALKVEGKKLYELARQGLEVERKGRKIKIYSLSAKELESGEIELCVSCSRGTYIRTLVEDIGNALGCGATMSALKRSAVGYVVEKSDGVFDVSSIPRGENVEMLSEEKMFVSLFDERYAVPLESLKKGKIKSDAVWEVEYVFSHYPEITFPEFYNRLFSNGCEIYLSKLEKNHPAKNAKTGDVFRVYGTEGFFALGQVKEYENGLAIKQIKRFN